MLDVLQNMTNSTIRHPRTTDTTVPRHVGALRRRTSITKSSVVDTTQDRETVYGVSVQVSTSVMNVSV